jgi:hypothetical protein
VRTLLLVPIVHTPAEMGFAQQAVREIKAEIYGLQWTERYEAEVYRFWNELEARLSNQTIDRVYNDPCHSVARLAENSLPRSRPRAVATIDC